MYSGNFCAEKLSDMSCAGFDWSKASSSAGAESDKTVIGRRACLGTPDPLNSSTTRPRLVAS